MQGQDAVRHMVKQSGMSARAVSTAMGRAPSYLSAMLARPSYDVTLSTLARVADVCGYSVQIVGHDESVCLDPTDQTSDA